MYIYNVIVYYIQLYLVLRPRYVPETLVNRKSVTIKKGRYREIYKKRPYSEI